jgi:hypothetical protein
MASRNGLFGRVMDKRVFKQVADFCSKRVRTKNNLQQQRSQRGMLDKKCEPDPEHSYTSSDLPPTSASSHSVIIEESNDDNSDTSMLEVYRPTNSMEHRHDVLSSDSGLPRWNPGRSINNAELIGPMPDQAENSVAMRMNMSKPPLGSRYPEVVTYVDRHGEERTAIAMTKTMVWQLNTVFRCEKRIALYRKKLEDTDDNQMRAEKIIEDIHKQLQKESDAPSFDRQHVLEELNTVKEMILVLEVERDYLVSRIENAKEEMGFPQRQFFRDWEELLDDNNLLEPEPPESTADSAVSERIRPKYEQRRHRMPTSSEAARNAITGAQDAALEDKHEKAVRLHDAHDKLDLWNDYYGAEYQKYCVCVEEGKMTPARTMFDNVLLQENQEVIKELIQAENEFEEARKLAKKLEVGHNEFDQESEFLDYLDDGYRESMEAAIVGHVDRDSIVKWMEEKDHRTFSPIECDTWESKTIDLSDSVSLVAEGRERKRIDRWRSACELLEVPTAMEEESEQ